jgi:hypothetical protein
VLRLFADPPFAERQVDGVAWRAARMWSADLISDIEARNWRQFDIDLNRVPETAQRQARPLFPRQPRADKLHDYAEWLDVCQWIADPQHTPPEARFLVPRIAYTFKWYAGRGEVVNWKESPQDAAGLHEWWRRIQEVYATGNRAPQDIYFGSLAERGAPRLQALAREYQADYLVTQVSIPLLPLPVVYKNDAFVVYKMK